MNLEIMDHEGRAAAAKAEAEAAAAAAALDVGSEPDTEEDDPDLARRARDRRFLANAADTAWQAAGGAGTFPAAGLPGLLLVERFRSAGYRRAAAVGPGGANGENQLPLIPSRAKVPYVIVAGVEAKSAVFYAGSSFWI
jgi:hypothetical protein